MLTLFEMPSAVIIADYSQFIDALYRQQVFGKKTYYKEVVRLVCERLAVLDLKAITKCSSESRNRRVNQDGLPRAPQHLFDFETVQTSIITLFIRLGRFERDCGINHLFQTGFIPNAWDEK